MPAISSPDDQWFNVYAASGFAVGAGLLVQNQSSAFARMQISATSPIASDMTGRRVAAGEEVQVDQGAVGLWMRCTPTVQAYVQTYT